MPRTPRWRHGLGRLLLVSLLLVAFPLTGATAWADSGLVAADPADGAALPTAPRAVTLIFAAPPDPVRSHMSAVDPTGTVVSTAEVTRAGPSGLRLPVSIHVAGTYTVAYHAVLMDGSETAGALRFSVGTGIPPAEPADAAPVAVHHHEIDPFSAGLLVLDMAVLLAVILLLQRRTDRT